MLAPVVKPLYGVRDLLSGNGMSLLPDNLTLSELLVNGTLAFDDRSGRAKMVASFGAPIFVHVPKTGGTTMIAALRKQSWQPHANDFHYRHIVYQTTQSTTADLFDPAVTPSLGNQTMCVVVVRFPPPC